MNRIASTFSACRSEQRATLVIYLTAGDPDLETTPALVVAAAESGADVIELGMPFSDPTADGPAIQRASERALSRGASLAGVFDAVRSARERSQVPIVLFGYYNPILAYGEEAFCRAAADAGVDGLLVVDLPVEEGASLRGHAERAGLAYVPLVAPTSSDARVDRAAAVATGFVYYVSTTGVTGAAAANLDRAGQRAGSIGERTGRPVAVGFGIKTPEDVALVAQHADGAVVGSAVVRAIEEAPDPDAAERAVRTLVSRLAAATAR